MVSILALGHAVVARFVSWRLVRCKTARAPLLMYLFRGQRIAQFRTFNLLLFFPCATDVTAVAIEVHSLLRE